MNESKAAIFFVAFLVFFSNAYGQTGGTFTITESVVAGGGGQSATGGTFSLDGTIGQAVAGNAIRGTPFAVTSGFWNFTPSSPTAASVSVRGRVRTANGAGIRNAIITIAGQDGSIRAARSSSFGYYRIDGIAAGQTYVASVSVKRFTFSQPTIVVGVFDEITDLDFVADPLL